MEREDIFLWQFSVQYVWFVILILVDQWRGEVQKSNHESGSEFGESKE